MITDLRILDDDTALAEGPKFDRRKVTESAIAFLRIFMRAVIAADPSVKPTLHFAGDAGRTSVLDRYGYHRLRGELAACGRHYDVDACCVRIDAGPFRLRCYLHGQDDLRIWPGKEPTIMGEAPWTELDPTPVIRVSPSQGTLPLFDSGIAKFVRELLVAAAPPGVEVTGIHDPCLRFDHAAFGDGVGTLRISLHRIPQDLADLVDS